MLAFASACEAYLQADCHDYALRRVVLDTWDCLTGALRSELRGIVWETEETSERYFGYAAYIRKHYGH